MSTEILVNIGPQETRVALVEGGATQEIYVQRAARHGLVGNIYKGVVVRVLPGMQAAFVELGLDRTAFLHVADMVATEGHAGPLPPVERLLTDGQEVLVQILKDPMGSKGARLTTLLSIPSRYLVLMPFEKHVGVSARIEDETERSRLKAIMEKLAPELSPNWGVIARTAAEGADEDALRQDLTFLTRLWGSVNQQTQFAKPGHLVHGDLPLSMRILRDLLGTAVERIRIDNAEEARRVQQFARVFVPAAAAKIEAYNGHGPIFDMYGVEDELNRALLRKVDLKSGGHLIIDQTEAMTTIDVNTGAFTGHRNLDETIVKTNLEAAGTIARQLRLRNLGGIIIIDFIDMAREEHQAAVLAELKKQLVRDRTRITVSGFTQLGLVEMTRKRTRESLAHMLCEPCPTCHGRGEVKTARSVCHDILREILREARQFDPKEFRVIASAAVVEMLLDEESQHLAGLSDFIGKPISLRTELFPTPEQYDIVLL